MLGPKISKTFCLFFKSMIPFKAIKRLFFFSFNLREEQMLTDKISPADSFVLFERMFRNFLPELQHQAQVSRKAFVAKALKGKSLKWAYFY